MKELRKELRKNRRSIDQPSRKKFGRQILYQCQKRAVFRNAKHIAIFIPNDGEIETADTIKFLLRQGYFVYLPILAGEKLKFAKMGKLFKKTDLVLKNQSLALFKELTEWTLFLCRLLVLINIKIA